MVKIIFEASKCIGCGSCQALCPRYWELKEGRAHLKGAKVDLSTAKEELEIKEIDCNQEAADACPVQIIHIIKK